MSGTTSQAVRRFEVVRRDNAAATARTLGTVAIDAWGMMTILSAGNDPDGLLPLIIEEQNQRPNMNVSIPPPPDAPRFALVTRVVERGSDEFLPALAEHLKQYYMIELNEA